MEDSFGALLKDRITFGMGKDGRQSCAAQLCEEFVHLYWDAEVAQLDQQVPGSLDCEVVRTREHGFHVFIGDMEIAAEAELRLVADQFA